VGKPLSDCAFEGCANKATGSRGWCTAHYAQWRKGGALRPLRARASVAPGEVCSYPGCGGPYQAKGFCGAHYTQLLRTGEVVALGTPRRRSPQNRAPECSTPECKATPKKRGYCERHYRQARRRGEAGWNGERCSFEPCEGVAVSKGMCDMHYKRSLKEQRGPCAIDGCSKQIAAKGWCAAHYSRNRKYGDPLAWRKPSKQVCTVDDCKLPRVGDGLCSLHYRRMRRYGTTDLPPRPVHVDPEPFKCKQCGADLPKRRAGKRSYCSTECAESWAYWWRQTTHRSRWLKKYGLTVEDFDRILQEQNGRCAICGSDDPRYRNWCVDHDHETGAVRGLLCILCNSGLGKFRDDVDTIYRAAQYLLDHRAKGVA
jgi:hypothetical protein